MEETYRNIKKCNTVSAFRKHGCNYCGACLFSKRHPITIQTGSSSFYKFVDRFLAGTLPLEWSHRIPNHNGSRNHVRTHHSLKTHAGREHGNNFRIFRQFGSKENNGNEYEQRTEQIREIGDKVHVIFKDDFTQGAFMLHKLCPSSR